MTQNYVGTKIVLAWMQEKDGVEGYAVKYADGYTSWSPKETFEEANIALGNIEHLPAFQQRLVAEAAQLDTNIAKLKAFLYTPESPSANLPEIELQDLTTQLTAMVAYSKVLHRRLGRLVGDAHLKLTDDKELPDAGIAQSEPNPHVVTPEQTAAHLVDGEPSAEGSGGVQESQSEGADSAGSTESKAPADTSGE